MTTIQTAKLTCKVALYVVAMPFAVAYVAVERRSELRDFARGLWRIATGWKWYAE